MDARVAEAQANLVSVLPHFEDGSKEIITDLLQIIVDSDHANNLDAAADAIAVLFDASCSGSGTRVYATNSSTATTVGVLLLGFAGSALPHGQAGSSPLRPIIEFYEKMDYKVVSTVATGFSTEQVGGPASEAQIEKVVQSLAGCKKILVHLMSNNGQGMWSTILHQKGNILRSRVAAVIYDCAASRTVGQRAATESDDGANTEQMAHVITSTVYMPLLAKLIEVNKPGEPGVKLSMRDNDAVRGPCGRAALHLAERYVARGTATGYFWANRPPRWGSWAHPAVPPTALKEPNATRVPDIFSFDAAHTPAVPVLVLTSPGDTIITMDSCEDWMQFLRRHQPHRSIEMVVLHGTHCLLFQSQKGSERPYDTRVKQLIDDAKLNDKAAPIQYATPAGGGGAADGAGGDGGAGLDAALASLLERANLQPLASVDGLASRSLEELCTTYSEKGRTGFISHSKELGVSTLGERQKLASAIAKHVKEMESAVALS